LNVKSTKIPLVTDVPDLKLIFDTAHITMGASSKPMCLVNFLNKYGTTNVHSFHFKDYSPDASGDDYFSLVEGGCFPELGKGVVDFGGVREWQLKNNWQGWIVVEQDILGDPKEGGAHNGPFLSAMRNRAYLDLIYGINSKM